MVEPVIEPAADRRVVPAVPVVDAGEAERLQARVVHVPEHDQDRGDDHDLDREHHGPVEEQGRRDEPEGVALEDGRVEVAAEEDRHEVRVGEDADGERRRGDGGGVTEQAELVGAEGGVADEGADGEREERGRRKKAQS